MREAPGRKSVDRVRACLVQYGIIQDDPKRASAEQKEIQVEFEERVTVMKGNKGKLTFSAHLFSYHGLLNFQQFCNCSLFISTCVRVP